MLASFECGMSLLVKVQLALPVLLLPFGARTVVSTSEPSHSRLGYLRIPSEHTAQLQFTSDICPLAGRLPPPPGRRRRHFACRSASRPALGASSRVSDRRCAAGRQSSRR